MEKHDAVLVVDDEQVIRDLLTDILGAEDFEVYCAGNSFDALKLLEEHAEIAVLFSDIMMPEMDGIELIRAARRMRPEIIPIVMTGHATVATARAAVQEGAYDYVLKPFSLSEITLAVTNAIDRHRLAAENARLREVSGLLNISETIAGIREEKALFQFVLDAALEHVHATRGSLMLTTPDGKALRVAASVGVPEEASESLVALGQGISGLVAQEGKPLLVRDIAHSPELAGRTQPFANGSFISVPLERKAPINRRTAMHVNEPVGCIAVLNVSQKRNSGEFTESDLKILNIVANHAAAAITNVRLIKSLEEAHVSTLRSMARLLEAKDPYTHGHSTRVRDYCILLGRRLGMSEAEISTLDLGAALHDIGKVGVADGVLNKVEPLTDEEWNMIRMHPVTGYEILKTVQFLTKEHLDLVRSHHERLDGSGYPDGLTDGELTPLVRVIAVADAYDAMSSRRAYRDPMPQSAIVEQLQRGAGTQFDPDVAHLFVELLERGQVSRNSMAGAL